MCSIFMWNIDSLHLFSIFISENAFKEMCLMGHQERLEPKLINKKPTFLT